MLQTTEDKTIHNDLTDKMGLVFHRFFTNAMNQEAAPEWEEVTLLFISLCL